LSTAAYTSESFDLAPSSISPLGIRFRPDGFKFYILTATDIHQFSVDSLDILTASDDSVSFDLTGETSDACGFDFNEEGSFLIVCDLSGDIAYQYKFYPFNLSTGEYTENSFESTANNVTYGGKRRETIYFVDSENVRIFSRRAGVEARDPREYTDIAFFGTVQCGEALAQCGERNALCNSFQANDSNYLVNLDLNDYAPPPIPPDPDAWRHFIYVGSQTFPIGTIIDEDRQSEFKRLMLKHFPASEWIVILAPPEPFEPLFDIELG
jgi:hypothetical protein